MKSRLSTGDQPAPARGHKLGLAHEPLTVQVAKALRDRILDGALAAGERLVETRLSEELGVSRMPVREALRMLAAEGLVVLEPRRGASVTSYSPELVQELVEVRATLESLNAKLAARRANPALIAELQRILADGARTARTGGDAARLQEDNQNFHEALASVAANSVLRDLVRSLRERTAPLFAPHSRKRARENWEDHAAIVRAVIEGDAELAGLLAARHVYSAASVLPGVTSEAMAVGSNGTSAVAAASPPVKPRQAARAPGAAPTTRSRRR